MPYNIPKTTEHEVEDCKLQLNEPKNPPTEIVEEIIKEIGEVTANYHRRKKAAAEADKKNIMREINFYRTKIENDPLDNPDDHASLAYLQDALDHINHNSSTNEVKLSRQKAQFKATKLRDKLSRPPPRKNTISEIITEEEDENGTTKQVKHKGQLRAQNAISDFYT